MRLNYTKLAAEATDSLWSLSKAVVESDLDPRLRELVAVYVSLRNKCAHCISVHWKKAVAAGVEEERLRLVTAFRENDAFTQSDVAALELAEQLTAQLDAGVPSEMVGAVSEHFGEKTAMHLIYHIILMNAWNRLSITIDLKPPS